ncbi:hypothetical protein ACIOFV_14950 [Streptomyces mirabilis]|uniref:hypothetical protein n=1 Tax=Streptomyces mirabilis TaxID=68239 RepID=UPI00380FB8A0
MTQSTVIAQDATEAVAIVLLGLARTYADNPREVEEGLLELANTDAGAAIIRDHVVAKLLKLARLPKVHRFSDTSEAYDASQCSEAIRDGDVLVVESERVVGFLDEAWPVAITEAHGEFHGLKIPAREIKGGRYAASADLAERIAAELGIALAVKPARTV